MVTPDDNTSKPLTPLLKAPRIMKLIAIQGTYSIVRYPPAGKIPAWVLALDGFFSVTRTADELSILCETEAVPSEASDREDRWKCLRVQGFLDFSLTGILSSLASPLAREKISIFAVSTFNTDYILTKADKFEAAKAVLRKANFEIA